MSSRNFNIFLFLLCACTLVGCKEQHNATLSANAAAEASPNGAITTRAPTSAEIADLQRNMAKHEAIDARYPGSETPLGARSERVIEVSVPGILKLESGRTVRLDGITCNAKAVGYMRRVLFDQGVTVAVLPSGNSQTSPIPAEVWMVDKSFRDATSYSNINETAITSHWCDVKASSTSKHNARYAALAKQSW